MNVLKQIFEVPVKTFCRKWEGGTLPKGFFNFKQPEKSQNEYYPDNLNLISFFSLISLQLLLFPVFLLKSNLLLYRKWKTFEGKIWPFFMTSKRYRFIFLVTHLLFIFVDKEIFFQEYTEMKLKTFFIIFEKDGNSHL